MTVQAAKTGQKERMLVVYQQRDPSTRPGEGPIVYSKITGEKLAELKNRALSKLF